jgi:anti-sigma B factor antagonist
VGAFYLSDHATEGDVHVIRVGGYIDFDVAPRVRECLVDRIVAGDRLIIVDLSDVGFIDSTTIGVLIGALKRLREVGGSLALVSTNGNVRGIFEIVGLESFIPLHSSRDDALAALAHAV